MKNPDVLIGKTIKSAKISKISDEFDDEPYLDLEFTDGTKERIVAGYGSYTGHSDDEYPRFIYIKDDKGETEK